MPNPMVRKLERGAVLTPEDRERLERTIEGRRDVPARTDLIREKEPPEFVHLILEGFACRYKMLRSGRRQIIAYLAPGDFCDLHGAILGEMDHSIATVTRCVVVDIARAEILDLVTNYPRINRALWWATLVDEAILRQWLVSLGQRPSDQKLAHLLCELRVRLNSVGLVTRNSFSLPVTQAELADTLGITSVHVNRMMQQLRADGLITTQGSIITIPDPARLEDFAEFCPNYLHLSAARRMSDAGVTERLA